MRAYLVSGCLAGLLAIHGAAAGPVDSTAGFAGEAASKQIVVQNGSLPPVNASLTPSVEVEAGLQTVLGVEVHTLTDRSVGRVVDLLADRQGHVRAAVIEFGGFLGLGTRKVAVDWSALRFDVTQGKAPIATAFITGDQLRLAPETKPGEPAVILKAAPAEPPAGIP